MQNTPPKLNGAAPADAEQFPPKYLEKAASLVEGAQDVAAHPLPGPLLDAFLPEALTAAGFELVPLTAAHFAIFQRIGSPVLRELAEMGKPADQRAPVDYTDEDLWELLFLQTMSAPKARSVLGLGREWFREAALAATADKLGAGVLAQKGQLLSALAANIARAFSTRLSHQAADQEGERKPVFTLPPAGPTTALAGGSTT